MALSHFFFFFFNLVCFEKKRWGNHNKDKKFMRWLEVSWWDQSYAVPAQGKASSLLLALPWGWHPTSKLITQVVGEGQGFDVNPRAGNYGFYHQGLPEAGCKPHSVVGMSVFARLWIFIGASTRKLLMSLSLGFCTLFLYQLRCGFVASEKSLKLYFRL